MKNNHNKKEGIILQISITDKMIEEHTGNSFTYKKGLMYYNMQKVQDFQFKEKELYLEAKVVGSKKYTVKLYLTKNGSIKSAYCNCPAFYGYEGVCKHVVAVLKKAQQTFSNKQRQILRNNNTVQALFSYFDNIHNDLVQEEIKLELFYHAEGTYQGLLSSLELKLGKDRLYVVKSIKNFLENLADQQITDFGKIL